jgi:hypothetical protein
MNEQEAKTETLNGSAVDTVVSGFKYYFSRQYKKRTYSNGNEEIFDPLFTWTIRPFLKARLRAKRNYFSYMIFCLDHIGGHNG